MSVIHVKVAHFHMNDAELSCIFVSFHVNDAHFHVKVTHFHRITLNFHVKDAELSCIISNIHVNDAHFYVNVQQLSPKTDRFVSDVGARSCARPKRPTGR